jgi:hypothetical protein
MTATIRYKSHTVALPAEETGLEALRPIRGTLRCLSPRVDSTGMVEPACHQVRDLERFFR